MGEMRLDPTTQTWVLVGEGRARGGRSCPRHCPFCPGGESRTPAELDSVGEGDWTARVISDASPVFHRDVEYGRSAVGFFDRMNSRGAHEIVIESRDHGKTMAALRPDEVGAALELYRRRTAVHKKDRRIRYVLIFKNQGRRAGSYIEHAHSHILGSPVIPVRLQQELRWARRHFEKKERCLFCDVMKEELRQKARIAASNDAFVAFCPYASRRPFEVWIFPRDHRCDFENHMAEDGVAQLFADMLLSMAGAVEAVIPDYQMVFHNSPNKDAHYPPMSRWETLAWDFHWHVEILPVPAGYDVVRKEEEFYINPLLPEDVAAVLRGEADASRLLGGRGERSCGG
ncbi:MAG TPA: hypothetical protein ENJ37_04455 [Deltaproteobacteria bacterium]|nr:hypothetical protein [Deltaproteobacteria bacterium]